MVLERNVVVEKNRSCMIVHGRTLFLSQEIMNHEARSCEFSWGRAVLAEGHAKSSSEPTEKDRPESWAAWPQMTARLHSRVPVRSSPKT